MESICNTISTVFSLAFIVIVPLCRTNPRGYLLKPIILQPIESARDSLMSWGTTVKTLPVHFKGLRRVTRAKMQPDEMVLIAEETTI